MDTDTAPSFVVYCEDENGNRLVLNQTPDPAPGVEEWRGRSPWTNAAYITRATFGPSPMVPWRLTRSDRRALGRKLRRLRGSLIRRARRKGYGWAATGIR